MPEDQKGLSQLTYEQKVEKLDEILNRLDNSETPIDKLAEDVKLVRGSSRSWTKN